MFLWESHFSIFHNIITLPKTRVFVLPFGEKPDHRSSVFVEIIPQRDGQTDRQTARQTGV